MADEAEITMFTAMAFLKQTFNKYAREDAEKGTLSKKEFDDLLRDHVTEVSKKYYTALLF